MGRELNDTIRILFLRIENILYKNKRAGKRILFACPLIFNVSSV